MSDKIDFEPGSSRPGASIWSTTDGTRRFLLPNDVVLPVGDLVIRRSTGESRSVAAAVLLPFQLSVDDANAWAREELCRVLRQLGGNLQLSFAEAPSLKSLDEKAPDAPVTPGLDLLAAITNTPRADLDTGTLGAALKRYFGDIGTTVADAVSGDPARIERAKERMAEWSATLREHGTEDGEVKPTAGSAPDAGTAADAASSRAATEPQQPPGATHASGFAARLRDLAEQFRQRADALAAARAEAAASPPTPAARPDAKAGADSAGDATSATAEGHGAVADVEPAGPGPATAVTASRATAEANSEAEGATGMVTAAGQPEPPTSAETQAAALEALAEGLEDAAGDAAARLRAQAARLRGGS